MKKSWMIGLAALLLLAGCGGGSRTLPAEEAQAFAKQVDAMSENLLLALNDHDYVAYTRDMDEQMRAASPEEEFGQVYEMIIGKIGRYVSREMTQVVEQGRYRTVVYDARFEQEEHVTVRVVYDISGERLLVSGLWFDSPKLRGQ